MAFLSRYAAVARQAAIDSALMVFVGFLFLLAWAWDLT